MALGVKRVWTGLIFAMALAFWTLFAGSLTIEPRLVFRDLT